MNELLARVRANCGSNPDGRGSSAVIDLGDFQIDLEARTSSRSRGREVKLTPKEFDLLVYLARHPGRVIPHRTILGAVWGHEQR